MTRKYLRGLAWGFYFLGAVLLAVTFMPGLALGSSQSAPQDPVLKVVGVTCHDKFFILFHFQLQNWGGGAPPAAVTYTVNGSNYAAPEWKQGGTTVDYLGLVPCNGEGVYNLTGGNAGQYQLSNPGTFTVACGNSATSTPTEVAPTFTPTAVAPTSTPTAIAPTATPTLGGGGNATSTPTNVPGQPTNTPVVALPTAVSTPVALAPTTGQELAITAISRLQILGSLAVGLILIGFALQWASGRSKQAD